MDSRAAKLALARQKLKDHQDKKLFAVPKETVEDLPKENLESSIIKPEYPLQAVFEINKDCEDMFRNSVTESESALEIPGEPNHVANSEVNVTEILISSKRNLEIENTNLQTKLSELEHNHTLVLKEQDLSNQQIKHIKMEYQDLHEKYLILCNEFQSKDKLIDQLNLERSKTIEEYNNLMDQLEFTKTILSTKESENVSLVSQMSSLQSQLDATQLKLKQLTDGSETSIANNDSYYTDRNETLQQKISDLEHKIKFICKEKDQMKLHYEHYVGELNEQLKEFQIKNRSLQNEVDQLCDRERGLVDQISQMEIRIQNYIQMKDTMLDHSKKDEDFDKLKQKYSDVQEQLKNLSLNYEELQKCYNESEEKVKELSEIRVPESNHDDISMVKLNADIASDKIAAQRATEQNKKLKADVEELQEAFVKMSNDKLQLTEKLAAEKFLNRELTIKLAEVEEKAKTMHVTLMAKDEEMIRLQTNLREVEKKFEQLIIEKQANDESNQNEQFKEETKLHNHHVYYPNDGGCEHACVSMTIEKNSLNIPTGDAMSKLQERFLKIMDEVADLSDEKHRLEHIILQLQNETDTICEYVALYQQQRGLLKKRDEERAAQIKLFQSECDTLKIQIEELTRILVNLSKDEGLSSSLKEESRQGDVAKIMDLLSKLKSNSLIDPIKNTDKLRNFYPCSCCSGNLIDI